MKKLLSLIFLLPVSVALLCLTSCSESDGDSDEYAQWQEKNDAFFTDIYQTAQQRIAQGDASWKIIRNWSLSSLVAAQPTQNIVVKVLQNGTGTTTPLYSDTTHVSYMGHLIPSENYEGGYVFEKTYVGDFNPATAIPVKLGVSQTKTTSSSGSSTSGSTIDGMVTTLMNMHVGDRWEVYIPYNLGYGSSASNSLPAYSTLIFDIYLHDYWHAGAVEKK